MNIQQRVNFIFWRVALIVGVIVYFSFRCA